MPWHDQKVYLDGLEEELRARMETLQQAGGGAPSGERTETFDLTTSAGLAEMGIQVRRRE